MTTFSVLFTVPDPDLEIRGGRSSIPVIPGHPLHKRGGSSKTFFRPFGPQIGLNIRGEPGPLPGPLPWIHHWLIPANVMYATYNVRPAFIVTCLFLYSLRQGCHKISTWFIPKVVVYVDDEPHELLCFISTQWDLNSDAKTKRSVI